MLDKKEFPTLQQLALDVVARNYYLYPLTYWFNGPREGNSIDITKKRSFKSRLTTAMIPWKACWLQPRTSTRKSTGKPAANATSVLSTQSALKITASATRSPSSKSSSSI
jgi:hypothetical protein